MISIYTLAEGIMISVRRCLQRVLQFQSDVCNREGDVFDPIKYIYSGILDSSESM